MLRGTVIGPRAGAKLTVQERRGDRWAKVGTVRTTRSGAYRWRRTRAARTAWWSAAPRAPPSSCARRAGYEYTRTTLSATQTGFSVPSRSKEISNTHWAPPGMSETSLTFGLARTLDGIGTGAGKRTLFRP